MVERAVAYEQMRSCQRRRSPCPGSEDPERIIGTDRDDRLRGRGGDDFLEGAGGDDTLIGERGADSLFGRTGNDRLAGGLGGDELEGGRGDDRLLGEDGSDQLNGGFGRDRILAGPGDDTIRAVGGGSDVIDCGPGRDRVEKDSRDRTRRCEIVLWPGGRAGRTRAVSCPAHGSPRDRRGRRTRPGRGRRRGRRDDEGHRPDRTRARALITQKAPGVVFGIGVAEAVFAALDPAALASRLAPEGQWRDGGPVLEVIGSAAALLSAERTALNLLGRLSGVATLTARYVAAIEGTGARVLDTRKTTPGLRVLEKAAVVAGGGTNHRAGLYDAILIKENHAAMAGGVAAAVRAARAMAPDVPMEVECRTVDEVDEALEAGARLLLLDNMTTGRAARGRGPRGRPRAARGQRRRDPRDDPGDRRIGRTIRVGRCPHALGPGPRPLPSPGATAVNLPMAPQPTLQPRLSLEEIARMQDEIRALARERDAVILAHNYQLPEVQDVADYVGDSLGLSQQAAATDAAVIAFCGVHFMAETASVLSPDKLVLIPDADAGCSLADAITPDQLRAWQAKHPGAITVMYVNTTAEIKALTDYCVTSANAVAVVEHILREHGPDTEILFGPDMFLGAYVEKTIGRPLHVWDGECHVHAGIRPSDITTGARRASRARTS